MIHVSMVVTGLGRVGGAFIRLLEEKADFCRLRFGLDLELHAAICRDGGLFSHKRHGLTGLGALSRGEVRTHPAWNAGLTLSEALSILDRGVLVECTPTDLRTGEPGLGYIQAALHAGWHVAAASKGALVLRYRELFDKAAERGVRIKCSGATAAALPTLDTATVALAGAEITAIDGILTGTTNHILGRMEAGMSFDEALREAQDKGIAEPDPALDIDGGDSACKILLIANSACGTELGLGDLPVTGIRGVTKADLDQASSQGKKLKLLGRLIRRDEAYKAEVGVFPVEPSHPLYHVDGTNKGIVFFTDTMGHVAVTGGKSDPRGTAAALLKDIINIYR
jgi:homoserine dehydrogenase